MRPPPATPLRGPRLPAPTKSRARSAYREPSSKPPLPPQPLRLRVVGARPFGVKGRSSRQCPRRRMKSCFVTGNQAGGQQGEPCRSRLSAATKRPWRAAPTARGVFTASLPPLPSLPPQPPLPPRRPTEPPVEPPWSPLGV